MFQWMRKMRKQRRKPWQEVLVDEEGTKKVSASVKKNKQILEHAYHACADLIIRSFATKDSVENNMLIAYLGGTANVEEINEHVMKGLQSSNRPLDGLKALEQSVAITDTKKIHTFNDVFINIADGKPVLFAEGINTALSLGMSKWATRAVEDTQTEPVIRGAKEGFVESMQVNVTLLRKRIRTPRLKLKTLVIGDYSRTQVALLYIDGLCDPELLKEVKKRINGINIDGVWDGGMVQEQIQDNQRSVFPQILTTERPDVVCASLLDGKCSLIFEGSPNTLILPTTFFAFMQSPEDYYVGYMISSLLRMLRFGFLLIALLAPAFYIAIVTFHQEMIPTTLIMAMASMREQVPFPALVEALVMEITFEGLREAGVRLPHQVGQAISIVGALVIGQAAIMASLVSPAMVIIVSITAIASFMIPHYELSISVRILRIPIMIIAGMVGLFGVVLSVIVIVVHLASLRSFGTPYLEPLAPFKKQGAGDSIIRKRIQNQNIRQHMTGKTWNKHRRWKEKT